jgi:alkylhydroperoxidase family enzyme
VSSANAPKIFKAYVDIAYALRSSADVAREFRELIILRTVQLSGGEYEFVQHRPMTLSCGMTPKQIDAIANWRESSSFDTRRRAILTYADEVAAEKGVSDAAFQTLAQFFNPQEIVELTITVGFYTAASRITKALDIKIEKGAGQAAGAYGKC